MVGHDRITQDGEWFFRQIEELKRLQTRVGIQQGTKAAIPQRQKNAKEKVTTKAYGKDGGGPASEVDMVDIAMFNELGTSRAPSRPVFAQSVDKNQEQIRHFCAGQLGRLTKKQADAQQVLQSCGVFQKGLIQTEFIEGEFTPNKPSTIKRKGSDRPLIDTGQYRQSINFVILTKGERS